ncbi:Pro-Pol polyprotein [Thelohanellus kitauei]|nr:Pro-Pol polyprotein [Thelohanellus kitauei]
MDEQTRDDDLKVILNYVKNKHWPDITCLNSLAKRYYDIRHQLKFVNGILCREQNNFNINKHIVIVPKTLRTRLIKYCHETYLSAHMCYTKTVERVLQIGYWPGVYSDTLEFCKSCKACTEASKISHKSPLQPLSVGLPWEVIGIDILELPITANGSRYLLVLQDYLGKWLHALPMKSQKASAIVKKISKVLSQFGPPRIIHPDQGRNFESFLFHELCKAWGINKSRTTSYHPQCNGLVERANRTLLNLLRKNLNDINGWDTIIDSLVYAYNTSKNASTKFSPYEIMFGREARQLYHSIKNNLSDLSAHLQGVKIDIAQICDKTNAELCRSGAYQKIYFDSSQKSPHPIVAG